MKPMSATDKFGEWRNILDYLKGAGLGNGSALF